LNTNKDDKLDTSENNKIKIAQDHNVTVWIGRTKFIVTGNQSGETSTITRVDEEPEEGGEFESDDESLERNADAPKEAPPTEEVIETSNDADA
jgi:hypothetical protein